MQALPYYSLNEFLKKKHGSKVIKLSIDGGFTCPNRDGKLSYTGCLFCSARGSGDFTALEEGSITKQLKEAATLLHKKWGNSKQYIAYFQAYTNTYAPLDELKAKYEEALRFPGVVGLAIGTRPDCLSPEILDYLEELSKRTHLWIELGLQTIHEKTAQFFNRGYRLDVFVHAEKELRKRGIETVVHLILGLPYETKDDMLASARYISHLPLQGVKLHMLHLLDDAPLANYYQEHPFPLLTEEAYLEVISEILELLPPQFVIHRLTGDGPKAHLIAPLWTAHKKQVLNHMNFHFKEKNIQQGKYYKEILSLQDF